MNKILKRVKLFLKEVMNVLTDVLVPLVALIIAILELLPVPFIWIRVLKQAEHILFKAFGTLEDIEEIIREHK